MTTDKHGLAVGINRYKDTFVVVIKASGKLTHDDYKQITPWLDSTLAAITSPQVNVLFDVQELEGWELRAAWDDLKLGFRHGAEFQRIAIVGQKKWQEVAAKVGNWFVEGDMQHFDNEREALHWLCTQEELTE